VTTLAGNRQEAIKTPCFDQLEEQRPAIGGQLK
jgi:hypothetical protein